ncbi:MAG: hypothetical protein CTY31_05085 [Hyphomicrobium sp.]|nr:MAG: hypothetical protein CTY39_03375 [Hyphomicrobium sp.]PPD00493.1 MAG: hypothetical protein CTY31_05085 [Hyphomicrobium sp.]
MSKPLHPPAYYIFCDEFGDQALRKAASEFFILSAIVVSAANEPKLPSWTARINGQRRNHQGAGLHFTDLDERTKLWATRFIGKMPLRSFVLISHKENMIGYRNVRAERAGDLRIYGDDGTSFSAQPRRTLRFPNFVLKILLERATAWCHRRSLKDYGEPRPVAIVIAQRGGFYLGPFKNYLEVDRRRYASKSGVLPGYLAWPVVETDMVTTAPAKNVAGLQIADIVAGAFSRAVDENRFGRCDRRFVENLRPRIAVKGTPKSAASWGVTGLPWELSEANLSSDQQKLFLSFGYAREKLVRPGLILPEGS